MPNTPTNLSSTTPKQQTIYDDLDEDDWNRLYNHNKNTTPLRYLFAPPNYIPKYSKSRGIIKRCMKYYTKSDAWPLLNPIVRLMVFGFIAMVIILRTRLNFDNIYTIVTTLFSVFQPNLGRTIQSCWWSAIANVSCGLVLALVRYYFPFDRVNVSPIFIITTLIICLLWGQSVNSSQFKSFVGFQGLYILIIWKNDGTYLHVLKLFSISSFGYVFALALTLIPYPLTASTELARLCYRIMNKIAKLLYIIVKAFLSNRQLDNLNTTHTKAFDELIRSLQKKRTPHKKFKPQQQQQQQQQQLQSQPQQQYNEFSTHNGSVFQPTHINNQPQQQQPTTSTTLPIAKDAPNVSFGPNVSKVQVKPMKNYDQQSSTKDNTTTKLSTSNNPIPSYITPSQDKLDQMAQKHHLERLNPIDPTTNKKSLPMGHQRGKGQYFLQRQETFTRDQFKTPNEEINQIYNESDDENETKPKLKKSYSKQQQQQRRRSLSQANINPNQLALTTTSSNNIILPNDIDRRSSIIHDNDQLSQYTTQQTHSGSVGSLSSAEREVEDDIFSSSSSSNDDNDGDNMIEDEEHGIDVEQGHDGIQLRSLYDNNTSTNNNNTQHHHNRHQHHQSNNTHHNQNDNDSYPTYNSTNSNYFNTNNNNNNQNYYSQQGQYQRDLIRPSDIIRQSDIIQPNDIYESQPLLSNNQHQHHHHQSNIALQDSIQFFSPFPQVYLTQCHELIEEIQQDIAAGQALLPDLIVESQIFRILYTFLCCCCRYRHYNDMKRRHEFHLPAKPDPLYPSLGSHKKIFLVPYSPPSVAAFLSDASNTLSNARSMVTALNTLTQLSQGGIMLYYLHTHYLSKDLKRMTRLIKTFTFCTTERNPDLIPIDGSFVRTLGKMTHSGGSLDIFSALYTVLSRAHGLIPSNSTQNIIKPTQQQQQQSNDINHQSTNNISVGDNNRNNNNTTNTTQQPQSTTTIEPLPIQQPPAHHHMASSLLNLFNFFDNTNNNDTTTTTATPIPNSTHPLLKPIHRIDDEQTTKSTPIDDDDIHSGFKSRKQKTKIDIRALHQQMEEKQRIAIEQAQKQQLQQQNQQQSQHLEKLYQHYQVYKKFMQIKEKQVRNLSFVPGSYAATLHGMRNMWVLYSKLRQICFVGTKRLRRTSPNSNSFYTEFKQPLFVLDIGNGSHAPLTNLNGNYDDQLLTTQPLNTETRFVHGLNQNNNNNNNNNYQQQQSLPSSSSFNQPYPLFPQTNTNNFQSKLPSSHDTNYNFQHTLGHNSYLFTSPPPLQSSTHQNYSNQPHYHQQSQHLQQQHHNYHHNNSNQNTQYNSFHSFHQHTVNGNNDPALAFFHQSQYQSPPTSHQQQYQQQQSAQFNDEIQHLSRQYTITLTDIITLTTFFFNLDRYVTRFLNRLAPHLAPHLYPVLSLVTTLPPLLALADDGREIVPTIVKTNNNNNNNNNPQQPSQPRSRRNSATQQTIHQQSIHQQFPNQPPPQQQHQQQPNQPQQPTQQTKFDNIFNNNSSTKTTNTNKTTSTTIGTKPQQPQQSTTINPSLGSLFAPPEQPQTQQPTTTTTTTTTTTHVPLSTGTTTISSSIGTSGSTTQTQPPISTTQTSTTLNLPPNLILPFSVEELQSYLAPPILPDLSGYSASTISSNNGSIHVQQPPQTQSVTTSLPPQQQLHYPRSVPQSNSSPPQPFTTTNNNNNNSFDSNFFLQQQPLALNTSSQSLPGSTTDSFNQITTSQQHQDQQQQHQHLHQQHQTLQSQPLQSQPLHLSTSDLYGRISTTLSSPQTSHQLNHTSPSHQSPPIIPSSIHSPQHHNHKHSQSLSSLFEGPNDENENDTQQQQSSEHRPLPPPPILPPSSSSNILHGHNNNNNRNTINLHIDVDADGNNNNRNSINPINPNNIRSSQNFNSIDRNNNNNNNTQSEYDFQSSVYITYTGNDNQNPLFMSNNNATKSSNNNTPHNIQEQQKLQQKSLYPPIKLYSLSQPPSWFSTPSFIPLATLYFIFVPRIITDLITFIQTIFFPPRKPKSTHHTTNTTNNNTSSNPSSQQQGQNQDEFVLISMDQNTNNTNNNNEQSNINNINSVTETGIESITPQMDVVYLGPVQQSQPHHIQHYAPELFSDDEGTIQAQPPSPTAVKKNISYKFKPQKKPQQPITVSQEQKQPKQQSHSQSSLFKPSMSLQQSSISMQPQQSTSTFDTHHHQQQQHQPQLHVDVTNSNNDTKTEDNHNNDSSDNDDEERDDYYQIQTPRYAKKSNHMLTLKRGLQPTSTTIIEEKQPLAQNQSTLQRTETHPSLNPDQSQDQLQTPIIPDNTPSSPQQDIQPIQHQQQQQQQPTSTTISTNLNDDDTDYDIPPFKYRLKSALYNLFIPQAADWKYYRAIIKCIVCIQLSFLIIVIPNPFDQTKYIHWSTTTSAVLISESLSQAFTGIITRISATALGAFIGYFIVFLARQIDPTMFKSAIWFSAACVSIWVGLLTLFKLKRPSNAGFSVSISVCATVVLGAIDNEQAMQYAINRISMAMLGCLCVIITTVLLWPSTSFPRFLHAVEGTLKDIRTIAKLNFTFLDLSSKFQWGNSSIVFGPSLFPALLHQNHHGKDGTVITTKQFFQNHIDSPHSDYNGTQHFTNPNESEEQQQQSSSTSPINLKSPITAHSYDHTIYDLNREPILMSDFADPMISPASIRSPTVYTSNNNPNPIITTNDENNNYNVEIDDAINLKTAVNPFEDSLLRQQFKESFPLVQCPKDPNAFLLVYDLSIRQKLSTLRTSLFSQRGIALDYFNEHDLLGRNTILYNVQLTIVSAQLDLVRILTRLQECLFIHTWTLSRLPRSTEIIHLNSNKTNTNNNSNNNTSMFTLPIQSKCYEYNQTITGNNSILSLAQVQETDNPFSPTPPTPTKDWDSSYAGLAIFGDYGFYISSLLTSLLDDIGQLALDHDIDTFLGIPITFRHRDIQIIPSINYQQGIQALLDNIYEIATSTVGFNQEQNQAALMNSSTNNKLSKKDRKRFKTAQKQQKQYQQQLLLEHQEQNSNQLKQKLKYYQVCKKEKLTNQPGGARLGKGFYLSLWNFEFGPCFVSEAFAKEEQPTTTITDAPLPSADSCILSSSTATPSQMMNDPLFNSSIKLTTSNNDSTMLTNDIELQSIKTVNDTKPLRRLSRSSTIILTDTQKFQEKEHLEKQQKSTDLLKQISSTQSQMEKIFPDLFIQTDLHPHQLTEAQLDKREETIKLKQIFATIAKIILLYEETLKSRVHLSRTGQAAVFPSIFLQLEASFVFIMCCIPNVLMTLTIAVQTLRSHQK